MIMKTSGATRREIVNLCLPVSPGMAASCNVSVEEEAAWNSNPESSVASSPSTLSLRSSYAGHHALPFGPGVAAPRVARRAKRGGRTRDRTLDLSRVKGTLSR